MIINWVTTKAQQFLPEQDAGLDELNVSFDFALSSEIMDLLYAQNNDCKDAGGTTPRMEEVEQCTEQLPTTPRMEEVEQCMEQLPRATQGAVAEASRPDENADAIAATQFELDEYELALT